MINDKGSPMMVKFIDGKKIYLRPVLKEDLNKDYLGWINDRDNDQLTSHALYPYNLEALEDYFTRKSNDRSCLWLAIIIKDTHQHIGNIELARIDHVNRNAEFRIVIDHKAQNQGYGYESSKLMIDHALKVLNLHRIYLGVHEDNKGAIALYKKLGFELEGTFRDHFCRQGQYSNVLSMGLLATDRMR